MSKLVLLHLLCQFWFTLYVKMYAAVASYCPMTPEQIEEKKKKENVNVQALDAILADDADKFADIDSENQIKDSAFSIPYTVPLFLYGEPKIVLVAAYFHAQQIIEYLISVNTDLTVKGPYGRHVIHYAAAGGSLECCKLLDSNLNYFKREDELGNLPMHYAVMSNAIDIVKYSFAHGISLSAVNHEGVSAMMLAAQYNCVDILQFLNANEVNLHEADSKGNNPLHYAAKGNAPDALRYLVNECGVLLSRTNHDAETPMVVACQNGAFATVKVLVEEFNEKVKLKNKKKLPITAAAGSGNLKLIKYLLEKGASLTDCTSQGLTPEDAALNNYQEYVAHWIRNKIRGKDID